MILKEQNQGELRSIYPRNEIQENVHLSRPIAMASNTFDVGISCRASPIIWGIITFFHPPAHA
jgi:hypothetical protein